MTGRTSQIGFSGHDTLRVIWGRALFVAALLVVPEMLLYEKCPHVVIVAIVLGSGTLACFQYVRGFHKRKSHPEVIATGRPIAVLREGPDDLAAARPSRPNAPAAGVEPPLAQTPEIKRMALTSPVSSSAVADGSLSLTELSEKAFWNVVDVEFASAAATTSLVETTSADRRAAFAAVERAGDGVRLVVTSRIPEDEGVRIEFVLVPGERRWATTLERIAPGASRCRGVIDLSVSELKSFPPHSRIVFRPLSK